MTDYEQLKLDAERLAKSNKELQNVIEAQKMTIEELRNKIKELLADKVKLE